jgi:ribulose kinase
MTILSVDVGTSHCKAGLFQSDGSTVSLATRNTLVHRDAYGHYFYNPSELWSTLCSCISEVMEHSEPSDVACIGIASFSEAGLVVNRRTVVQSGTPSTVHQLQHRRPRRQRTPHLPPIGQLRPSVHSWLCVRETQKIPPIC